MVFLLTLQAAAVAQPPVPDGAWLQHGGDPTATRYSPLEQIDLDSVGDLRLVWATELGFIGTVQGAPAAWGDSLFVSTTTGVVALDAATGQLRWAHVEGDGVRGMSGLPVQTPRGSPVVVPATAIGDLVVIAMPNAAEVLALDTTSGEPRWRSHVGDPDFAEALRTNPLLAGDLLVVGPTGADLSPTPGRLVALRVADGSVAWTFDLVPLREDDPARSTWGPAQPGRSSGVGGGSAWNAGAFDPESGVVLFGTGQPIPSDRLDPRRHEVGAVSPDLYTASFVALEAATGALRWYHQVVPGDEWSFDQHTVPLVTELPFDGGPRRVAILATTTGFVVVVDVHTGELLRAHAMVDGTVHLGYGEDGRPIIDDAMRRVDEAQVLRVCPGGRWANVAPGAFSPATGLLYRPNDLTCVRQGANTAPDDWQPGTRAHWLLSEARTEADFFDRWGALTAIDPLSGAVAWSFELPYPHDAGVLTTAGGLVFSAFADRVFRAFDAGSGALLWSHLLSAHSDAAPISYLVGGRQYVAVLAGRSTGVASIPALGLPATVPGPATLFAFALPEAP